MENLLIEMLGTAIAPEITAGLKLGNYILNGEMILDNQNNSSAILLNESAATEIVPPSTFGLNPAVGALTLAVAAGFLVMNSKLNKIQNELQNIKKDLSEIKKIVSDNHEYEVGKLFADFKTYSQEAKLNVTENKPKNLLSLRREFLKILNRVDTLMNVIQNRKKIIFLRGTFMQYVKLYYSCAECSILCSMAGREYNAALQLISDAAKSLDELRKNYRESFVQASANEVAAISYDDIPNLKQNYFQIKFMGESVKNNERIISGLERGKFTYIELDKKIQDLQNIKQPAMLLIK